MFRSGLDTDGIALTLRLIERFGVFGAKTSHGQGVVQFDGIPVAIATDWLARLKQQPAKSGSGGPSISNMFGTTVRLHGLRQRWWDSLPLRREDIRIFSLSEQSSWFPTSPIIRAMLRAELRQPNLTIDRHRLMGTIHGWGDPTGRATTKGSDVHVTHAYRRGDFWEMRIFAFAPNTNNGGNVAIRGALAAVDQLAEKIRAALNLGSDVRMTVKPYPANVPALLAQQGCA
ncbi:MAG TPA: hypothetical protein VG672_17040 [Bryobacteraceae bacterium]|nr:hypothetical protein [Bryobacteraceae bacterium]